MQTGQLQKNAARAGLLAVYLAALCLPAYIFFHDRGGTAIFTGLDFRTDLQLAFPLLGLYAFTFVTWQVLLATNLYWLRRVWPQIIKFHRFQGSFALLFAVFHPLFILVGFGLIADLHVGYVAPGLRWWVLPGYTALTILLGTTGTALLAWRGMNIPWWRKLHRLNYLVFALVWLHSWFIGTDTHTPLLRVVWLTYLVLAAVSVLGRYRVAITKVFRTRAKPQQV